MLRGGIGICTLWRHFRTETLYQKATVEKDTACLIWWTKSQMGWKAAWDGPKDRHPDPVPVGKIERVIVHKPEL